MKNGNEYWRFANPWSWTVLIPALFIVCMSCGDDDEPPATPIEISASDIVASNPDWSIVSYIEGGQDKTADFNGSSFEIFTNGDFLINLNGINDSFGGWTISSDELVLTINISNPKPATSGIDGDWNLTSKSGNALTLVSADGENKTFRLSK